MRLVMIGAIALCTAASQAAIPMNQPVRVSGIRTVCTGVGMREEDNPQWDAYPVRVEFTDAQGAYTTGAHVVVSKESGATVAHFTCPANWALLDLAPGKYKVTARIGSGRGSVESASLTAPKNGQKDVILRFTSLAAQ
jgi:hypothetical protein